MTTPSLMVMRYLSCCVFVFNGVGGLPGAGGLLPGPGRFMVAARPGAGHPPEGIFAGFIRCYRLNVETVLKLRAGFM